MKLGASLHIKAMQLKNIRTGFFTAVAVTLALLLLYKLRQPLPLPLAAGPADRGPAADWDRRCDQRWQQCRRVLRMGEIHFSWEQDADQRCRKMHRSTLELQHGLRRLAKLRGRDVRVVFLGDSRVSIIYKSMVDRLNLNPLQYSSNVSIVYKDFFNWAKKKIRQGTKTSHQKLPKLKVGCVEANVVVTQKSPKVFCSEIAAGDALRSEFWWRPYLDDDFRERLDWLLSECAEGRCPDIVVVDSGAWYIMVEPQFPEDLSVARVTRFIAELAGLRSRLQRLTASTRVMWKLAEPYMPETKYGHKMSKNRMYMVLSSVIYETASRLPDLTAWSSGVVEAMQFYHEVCRPNRKILRDSKFDPVRQECWDPGHVGSTVRWKLVQSLFNVLFLDVTKPASGFCCGS